MRLRRLRLLVDDGGGAFQDDWGASRMIVEFVVAHREWAQGARDGGVDADTLVGFQRAHESIIGRALALGCCASSCE